MIDFLRPPNLYSYDPLISIPIDTQLLLSTKGGHTRSRSYSSAVACFGIVYLSISTILYCIQMRRGDLVGLRSISTKRVLSSRGSRARRSDLARSTKRVAPHVAVQLYMKHDVVLCARNRKGENSSAST